MVATLVQEKIDSFNKYSKHELKSKLDLNLAKLNI